MYDATNDYGDMAMCLGECASNVSNVEGLVRSVPTWKLGVSPASMMRGALEL